MVRAPTGFPRHGGLAEDAHGHRPNSRTVHMDPASRFIHWNMSHHVEHRMSPMGPCHALPRLHAIITRDLPPTARPYRKELHDARSVPGRESRAPDGGLEVLREGS